MRIGLAGVRTHKLIPRRPMAAQLLVRSFLWPVHSARHYSSRVATRSHAATATGEQRSAHTGSRYNDNCDLSQHHLCVIALCGLLVPVADADTVGLSIVVSLSICYVSLCMWNSNFSPVQFCGCYCKVFWFSFRKVIFSDKFQAIRS